MVIAIEPILFFLICNYDKNKREKDIPFIFLKKKQVIYVVDV